MNGKGGKVPLSVARHSAYNAIALEQIKNELQPYETSQQALGGGGGGQLVAPLKRKPSIEKDAPQSPLHMQRTSPALDSGAGSSRSNSPHSQQPFSAAHVVGRSSQYSPSPCPTNFSDAPPIPPPRCSSTPSTPQPPNPMHLLKRMSPASVASGRNGQFGGAASQSPARGSSPIASSGNHPGLRQPIIVQNGPQVQQQLSQQMAVYTGNEPPPPYPQLGPSSPPNYLTSFHSRQSPTQSSSAQSDFRKSPSSGFYSNASIGSSSPITVSQGAGGGGGGSGLLGAAIQRPIPLQPKPSAVHAPASKAAQHPIIMHSVKSTQVQKPILQTAVAPAAPAGGVPGTSGGSGGGHPLHNNPPPPSYAVSVQAKLNKAASGYATPPPPSPSALGHEGGGAGRHVGAAASAAAGGPGSGVPKQPLRAKPSLPGLQNVLPSNVPVQTVGGGGGGGVGGGTMNGQSSPAQPQALAGSSNNGVSSGSSTGSPNDPPSYDTTMILLQKHSSPKKEPPPAYLLDGGGGGTPPPLPPSPHCPPSAMEMEQQQQQQHRNNGGNNHHQQSYQHQQLQHHHHHLNHHNHLLHHQHHNGHGNADGGGMVNGNANGGGGSGMNQSSNSSTNGSSSHNANANTINGNMSNNANANNNNNTMNSMHNNNNHNNHDHAMMHGGSSIVSNGKVVPPSGLSRTVDDDRHHHHLHPHATNGLMQQQQHPADPKPKAPHKLSGSCGAAQHTFTGALKTLGALMGGGQQQQSQQQQQQQLNHQHHQQQQQQQQHDAKQRGIASTAASGGVRSSLMKSVRFPGTGGNTNNSGPAPAYTNGGGGLDHGTPSGSSTAESSPATTPTSASGGRTSSGGGGGGAEAGSSVASGVGNASTSGASSSGGGSAAGGAAGGGAGGSGGGGGGEDNPRKIKHQSPIPERKNLSKEKEAERSECKVKHYSPQAYKFFMEQHIENVLKSYSQRNFRIKQLESEMSKLDLPEETKIEMRKLLCQKESNYIRLKRAKMDKSMFAKIKTIGVGAFGEVTLVKKIDTTNHLYAMKTLRKADVLKRNQVAHVKAERDILAEADNEWVVKLYYSFQDKDNLYFVMDYIPGGDLMSLLIKKGIFEEDLARFYIAELTCAIDSVHKMGFIHRDIKPDNVLIDRKGHIKLTDFGLCTGFRWTHDSKYYQKNDHARQDSMEAWSKFGPDIPPPLERRKFREKNRAKAHSIVGTPNYIAPEVLMRSGNGNNPAVLGYNHQQQPQQQQQQHPLPTVQQQLPHQQHTQLPQHHLQQQQNQKPFLSNGIVTHHEFPLKSSSGLNTVGAVPGNLSLAVNGLLVGSNGVPLVDERLNSNHLGVDSGNHRPNAGVNQATGGPIVSGPQSVNGGGGGVVNSVPPTAQSGPSTAVGGGHNAGGATNPASDQIDLELKQFIVEKKELDSSCPSSPANGVLLMQQQTQQQLLEDEDDLLDDKDSKIFTSKADLQLHTQIHMREAKPYKCSQCNKAFANSSYLSQHTRIHLGIKPYRCEICQRKFTQLSHLQQHIRTHTGDKPYKCRHSGCLKAFSQLSNLQSHSRCHQTDKPYKCNSCYKCFADEPALLEHIPKHKESKHLKTHICQYCGKSYTQETYLSKHMQKHAERTDKRPPIGTRSSSSTVNLSASTPGSSSSSGSASNGATSNGGAATSMAGESAFWPKVSPDSAAATINDVINQQNNHHEFSLTPNGSATNGSTGNGPQSNGTDHPGGGPPQQQQQQQQQHHNQRDDAVDEMVGPAAARGPPDSVVGNGAPNGGNAGSGAANQASGQQQQQQQQPPPQQQHNGTMNGGNLAIPPVSTPMSYDTGSIAKATSNSAFTPINAMPPHLNGLQHHHQLATQRPSYLYDAISFQNQKAAMSQSPSNAFPNQLISLHQIRNYAHQPAGGLMAGEHLLGVTVGPGGKDKG